MAKNSHKSSARACVSLYIAKPERRFISSHCRRWRFEKLRRHQSIDILLQSGEEWRPLVSVLSAGSLIFHTLPSSLFAEELWEETLLKGYPLPW